MENKKPKYELLKSLLRDQVNEVSIPNQKLTEDIIKKRKKVEETHTRRTYLVRNDLANRLDHKKSEIGNGFLIRFINYAIETALDEIDKINSHNGNSKFSR